VVVLNPWFMVAFFGTGAACVLALISALMRWYEPGAVYVFVGSALYLVGTLLVTMVFNVPRNTFCSNRSLMSHRSVKDKRPSLPLARGPSRIGGARRVAIGYGTAGRGHCSPTGMQTEAPPTRGLEASIALQE